MDDISFKILKDILSVLRHEPYKKYPLEELTKIIIPFLNSSHFSCESSIATERRYQAKVLDSLIFLNNLNLIFLNPVTDESSVFVHVKDGLNVY